MTKSLSIFEAEKNTVMHMQHTAELAKKYSDSARSQNTNRAYRSDWQDFEAWCTNFGVRALPASPSTIGLYLTDRSSTLKPATLSRRLTSIREAHKLAGFTVAHNHPAISEVWKGIRNEHGTDQKGKVPILAIDIREMVNALPATLIGVRDRALLLVGFAGAFRRSEIVSLDVDDLSFGREGLTVRLRRSKTDQQGRGRDVGIPYGSNVKTCPIRSMQDWLSESEIDAGPLFRGINRHGGLSDNRLSDKSVALIVKRAAFSREVSRGLSFEEAEREVRKFGGHSLRAGLATSAAQAGVPEHTIMRQTGHKRPEMLRKYIRMGTIFTDNAAAKIGL